VILLFRSVEVLVQYSELLYEAGATNQIDASPVSQGKVICVMEKRWARGDEPLAVGFYSGLFRCLTGFFPSRVFIYRLQKSKPKILTRHCESVCDRYVLLVVRGI